MTHAPTLTVTLDDVQVELRNFRAEDSFEGVTDYVLSAVLGAFRNIDSLFTIRCNLSGFPIAEINDFEIEDMLRHATASLKLTAWDDLLRDTPDEEITDGIERLFDEVQTRVLMIARKGPSIAFERDRLAMGNLTHPRQLALLLNLLMWDAGMFRDKHVSSDDMIERVRRSAKVADQIILNWTSEPDLEVLRLSLIELDAKYRIKILKFSRKENDKLLALRESTNAPLGEIITFVQDLIRVRDDRIEVVQEPARWTQDVYRREVKDMVDFRREFSNVLRQPTAKEIKESTPEAIAKKRLANKRESLMAAAMMEAFKL